MELYYKITTGVLLLLHCFHMGLFQDPRSLSHIIAATDPPGFTTEESWYLDSDDVTVDHTDSAGRTMDRDWLRVNVKPVNERTEGEAQENMVSSGEMTTMSISSGEGSDVAGPDQEANRTYGDNATVLSTVLSTVLLLSPNETVTAETTTAPTTTTTTTTTAVPTTGPAELINETGAEEGSAYPPTTSFPDISNDTDLNDVTTVTPGTNATQAGTGPDTNVTENTADVTTTEVPLIDAEPTTLTTTDLPPPPETTAADASNDTTTAAPDTPDAANMTLDGQASGTNSERGNSGGLASEATSGKRSRRSEAWSAILGTGVAVAFVGMVVYVIVRKRNQRDFSHRKLVEEFPSDPVLRLDNNEPLDLDFGGSAYYNRAMQADDIQMNSFPGGQQH